MTVLFKRVPDSDTSKNKKVAVINGPRGEKGVPGITTVVNQNVEVTMLDGGNF